MDCIKKYFSELNANQLSLLEQFQQHIIQWNEKINVISRKDMEAIEINHILHSLAIAKLISFKPGTKVLDVGTGGGFPGIPLAIFFPEVSFHLIDSIGKKINVVNAFIEESGIKNVTAEQIRAENVKGRYDFIVSRAVTAMPRFLSWTHGKISTTGNNSLNNGFLVLKGGDLTDEFAEIKKDYSEHNISQWFEEPFFETKKVIHLAYR